MPLIPSSTVSERSVYAGLLEVSAVFYEKFIVASLEPKTE